MYIRILKYILAKAKMFNGNKIYKIDKKGAKKRIFFIFGLKIKFKGKNSSVTIQEPFPKFKKCKIHLGDNCQITIDKSIHKINKLTIWAKVSNATITIGNNFSLTKRCTIVLDPESNLNLKIGNDCMFASDIMIRATDSHKIIDLNNNEIINPGKDIIIGNHVWLGYGTTILKGAKIKDNCVIGANSTVTKPCIYENAIYAGSPAKCIKRNIQWRREAP